VEEAKRQKKAAQDAPLPASSGDWSCATSSQAFIELVACSPAKAEERAFLSTPPREKVYLLVAVGLEGLECDLRVEPDRVKLDEVLLQLYRRGLDLAP